uniref:Beta-defensin n=1 Tax=Suricata suricatta TaxID=37032 RepID=A0A673UTS6_SURSU
IRYVFLCFCRLRQMCQQLFLGLGEFAVCEPCWLGRGKCKKMCAEEEKKVVGNCKLDFFCCRRRIR